MQVQLGLWHSVFCCRWRPTIRGGRWIIFTFGDSGLLDLGLLDLGEPDRLDLDGAGGRLDLNALGRLAGLDFGDVIYSLTVFYKKQFNRRR